MRPFDIEQWLTDHSTKVERRGSELMFTHVSNETSVLLPRDPLQHGPMSAELEPLAFFYGRYVGASIGDSQLIFATPIVGGIDVSHGYRLPDLDEIVAKARALGVVTGDPAERMFITEAAWMFFYTAAPAPSGTLLKKYDRDFGTNQVIDSLEAAFDDWWSIVLAG